MLFLKPEAPTATMTPEEAEAVVRRHLEQVPEVPNGPSVADVAEALRLPPEQVARLLAEVRANPRIAKPRRRTTRRERRVWLLSGVVAAVLAGGVFGAMRTLHLGPFREYGGEAHQILNENAYYATFGGMDVGVAEQTRDMPPDALWQSVAQMLDRHELNARLNNPPSGAKTPQEIEGALNYARAGNWQLVSGVDLVGFEVRRPDAMGNKMRWARAEVPIYVGDDALIADLVKDERLRRVREAINEAQGGR